MPGDLTEYRRKRAAGRTNEPFGSAAAQRPGLFVVQRHDATRLHYDLRLEWGGTLKSWAVPRGPSFDPAEKRMAVHVEDHPVEYGDFEGVIPDGEYGAGPSICWDRGRWVALEDPVEGLEKGKLLFELHGYKLKGEWTLVRIKKSPKDWLLIKHRDAFAKKGESHFSERSIFSNLTTEELAAGRGPADEIRAELERLKAPRRALKPGDVELMLAESRDKPFSKPGWLFEIKYDGYRMLSFAEKGRVQLQFRRGRDATALYPEVSLGLSKLPVSRLALDGEVVVLDEESRPSFQRMQRRGMLTRSADVARATLDLPATYFAFDLLGFEDWDLRGLPLSTRKALLQKLIPAAGPARFADHFPEKGEALYAQVEKLGFEGIIAKKADSTYRGTRSEDWLKIATAKTGDFVVVGFTEPEGQRVGFSGIQVGAYEGKELLYCGSVGTGFGEELLKTLRSELEELRRATPACTGPIPKVKGQVWVEPTRVCEVRFKKWTEDGLLREPIFVRMRDDKNPAECVKVTPQADAPEPPVPSPPERKIAFSNLDKLFWPEDGYTKGDLINYYRAISPWLLHYLKGRPVVLTRFPDGIHGKSFFQKDAPEFVPSWIRREVMWSDDTQREIHHFVCDDEDSLAFLVNLGTIPLHIWSARVGSLEQPDWCIIDLDPKQAPFTHVVEIAIAVRELAEEIELPAFIKTTGSSGLHVLFPLGKQITHKQATSLAELIGRVICSEHPDKATMARAVGDRGQKVYLDYLQNGHGKLIASTFCVRPLATAPVSMPLLWSEVTPKLLPRQFTIANAVERMQKLKEDPFAGVLTERPDLGRVLARLAERQAEQAPSKRKRA